MGIYYKNICRNRLSAFCQSYPIGKFNLQKYQLYLGM